MVQLRPMAVCLYAVTIQIAVVLTGCGNENDKNLETLRYLTTDKLNDSLQNNAMLYLLRHIQDHSSRLGDKTQAYDKIINKYHPDVKLLEKKLDSLQKHTSPANQIINDTNLEADFLITHVAELTKLYENSAWKQDISFDTFCEYVLPYRIGQEPVTEWRRYFLEHFASYRDSISSQPSATDAARIINTLLYQERKGFRLLRRHEFPELSPITSSLLRVGTCHELSYVGVAAMRSFGVPATIDFTPHYANRAGGHEWCAIPLEDGKSVPFDVGSPGLNVYMGADYIPAKVYRIQYSVNKDSHYLLRGDCSFLPDFFNIPFLADVTDQYRSTADVEIPVIHGEVAYPYLCVFNNKTWVPVAWGKKNGDKANFKKLVKGVVYLPVTIDAEKIVHFNHPFLIDTLNKVNFLKPDNLLEDVKITRKYPSSPRLQHHIQRMIGGKLEGSNSPRFHNIVLLHTIEYYPGDQYSTVFPKSKDSFQYVRYLSPPGSWGNIAELEFYEKANSRMALTGSVIGTDNYWQNDDRYKKEKAFDGNPLTVYNSNQPDDSWLGLDLGRPVNIAKIRFLPRTDWNSIYKGQMYELYYWNTTQWISMGIQKSDTSFLLYKGVPKNSVLLLHNLTEGQEERIFMFKDGEQIWF